MRPVSPLVARAAPAVPAPIPAPADLASPHRVLWTGGWDSTFHVLKVVLKEGGRVEPVYVIDEERRSTAHEELAMAAIRDGLAAHGAGAAARLLPTRVIRRASIEVSPRIARLYEAGVDRFSIGSQYEWLAALSEQDGMSGLEVSWEKPNKTATEFYRTFLPLLVSSADGRVLGHDLGGHDAFELFRNFRFPNLDYTKWEMWDCAEQHGFLPLMQLTWFCHRPRSGRPCGRCTPCHYTVIGGLARRLPLRARWRWLSRHVRRWIRDPDGGFW